MDHETSLESPSEHPECSAGAPNGLRTRSISVVIASAAGGDFLFRCLDSLRLQAEVQKTEVIVVDRRGGETRNRLQKDYPFVTVVPVSVGRPSVPELRAMGVERATADIVAVIEEHCVAPPDWLETIAEAFQDGDVAVGGPILDADYNRLRDWVVYFSEYHNYLPPWNRGERYLLNGANVAYDRNALMAHYSVLGQGYWEVVLHPQLVREGRFRSVPSMGVFHTGPFDFGYYLSQRFLLSRVWGGTQRLSASLGKRLLYLVAAPIFPVLLIGRIASRVLKSGQNVGKFLLCIPMLVPVVTAYVFGEWLGYLVGVGDALERVE